MVSSERDQKPNWCKEDTSSGSIALPQGSAGIASHRCNPAGRAADWSRGHALRNTSCQDTFSHTTPLVARLLATFCKRRSKALARRPPGLRVAKHLGTASDLPASPVETLPLVRPNPAIPFLRDLAKGIAPAEALITAGPCCSSLLARQVVVIGVEAEAYEASAGQLWGDTVLETFFIKLLMGFSSSAWDLNPKPWDFTFTTAEVAARIDRAPSTVRNYISKYPVLRNL